MWRAKGILKCVWETLYKFPSLSFVNGPKSFTCGEKKTQIKTFFMGTKRFILKHYTNNPNKLSWKDLLDGTSRVKNTKTI